MARASAKPYGEARGHLIRAVAALAVGPDDLRARLPRVAPLLRRIRPADLPGVLREDWRWVFAQLTQRPPRVPSQTTLGRQRFAHDRDRHAVHEHPGAERLADGVGSPAYPVRGRGAGRLARIRLCCPNARACAALAFNLGAARRAGGISRGCPGRVHSTPSARGP
jgi:hypothetical protein